MHEKSGQSAPFLSLARFSPGTLLLLSILTGLSAILIQEKILYLAIAILPVFIVVLIVKTTEQIQIGEPVERKLVGRRCLVIMKVTKGQRGVVKLFRDDGSMDHELWSAEIEPVPVSEDTAIYENEVAIVVGIRGITLLAKIRE